MSNEKLKELLIVVFGGPFGIHKFIKGDIKMGVLYLFTAGLFGIGWIVDIVKVFTNKPLAKSKSLLTNEDFDMIHNGKYPRNIFKFKRW